MEMREEYYIDINVYGKIVPTFSAWSNLIRWSTSKATHKWYIYMVHTENSTIHL